MSDHKGDTKMITVLQHNHLESFLEKASFVFISVIFVQPIIPSGSLKDISTKQQQHCQNNIVQAVFPKKLMFL